ncbi:MAG: YchJ family metal-binding protein [Actinomycetota bacterium]
MSWEDLAVRCPCGSGRDIDECCGALHSRRRDALTAEELMRSRYSAFVVGDVAWLRDSWAPSSRPKRIHVSADDRWLGLTVVEAHGGPFDDTGRVHFIAEVERDGTTVRLEERSRFVRHEGRWVYLDGAG